MSKPPLHRIDNGKLLAGLETCRTELIRQTSPLYGKGGIALLAREIIRLCEDLAQLVSGDRDYFRHGQIGLTGPAGGRRGSPKEPPQEPE